MKRKIIGLFKFGSVLSLIISILILLKSQGWISTLIISLSIQISICCLLLAGVLFVMKKRNHAILAVLSCLVFSTQFAEFLFEKDPEATQIEFTKPRLKIAHFNVLMFNKKKAKTIQTILKCEADLVSLQETNEKWTSEIEKAVKKEYPYSVYFPSEKCCFGISLLSKKPLYNTLVTFHGGVPNIEADMIFNGTVTHLITSHTSSPISSDHLENRNQHIKDLKNHITQIDSPTIVIGDFNTVPWDNNLISFKNDTQLIDSRKSLDSTFPSYLGAAGIPIDYIFHSQEIACTQFQTVKMEGSDHFGIMGEFTIN